MRSGDLGTKEPAYFVIMQGPRAIVAVKDLARATDMLQGLRQQFPKQDFTVKIRQGRLSEERYRCAECGGAAVMITADLEEAKKDACYYKVRSRYKVWPSAYASGALVQCRKKGAANWGTKATKESLAAPADELDEQQDLDQDNSDVKDRIAALNQHAARAHASGDPESAAKYVAAASRLADRAGLAYRRHSAGIDLRLRGVDESQEYLDGAKDKFNPINMQFLVGAFLSSHKNHDNLQHDLARYINKWLTDHAAELGTMGFTSRDFPRIQTLMHEIMDVDAVFEGEDLEENLRKWFREKWVRFGPDGKIRGDCARGSDSEGKPKCLPRSKAHALGKKGRASAAARKRRQDPDADRKGPAKNVATKKESVAEGGAETSWSDGTEKITLQDILELTKHIKQINLPIDNNLKSKLIHWDGNPEEIERINQVTVSNQFPILVMLDGQGQIGWILDGNHRLHKAIRSQAKTIPAKLIKPSDLDDKAKRVFHIKEQGVAEGQQKTFRVVYYDPKTDRNVTKTIKAHNESDVWDQLKAKGIDVVSVKEQGVAEADSALDTRPTVLPAKSELILFVDGTEVATYDSMRDAVADAKRFAMRYPHYDIVIKRDVCTRTPVTRIQEGQSLGDLS